MFYYPFWLCCLFEKITHSHSFPWGMTKNLWEDVIQNNFCSMAKRTSPKQKNIPKVVSKATSIFLPSIPQKTNVFWSLPFFDSLSLQKVQPTKPPRCATWSPISIQHLGDRPNAVGGRWCLINGCFASIFWGKISTEEKNGNTGICLLEKLGTIYIYISSFGV